MEIFPWMLFLLLSIAFQGARSQDTVEQEPVEVTREGENATIACRYETRNFDGLHWYRQYPGEGLEFLLQMVTGEPNPKDHMQGDLDKKQQLSHLSFRGARLRDDATYFCALVQGSGYKVLFGSGTRLRVQPNIEDSDPSVYQLKPKDKETEMDQSTQKEIGVCLFTDYSPYTLQVGINKETQLTNGSLVVVKEDEYDEKGTASYGTVLWGTLDDEFHCNAVKNGKSFETNPEDAGTCSAEDEKPVFEADERLNLLSLSVLGLRIIFFKTIAFNVLFTFRVYSRRGRK